MWSPYLAERFLHNICPSFNIMFAQLGVITRKRNKFAEIVAASKRYLIINSGIKEAAVPTMPSREISWWKNVNKKGKMFFVPNLQYCQFEQDGWKNRIFFRKNKLRMNSQISRKFSYWENLLLFCMMLNKASAHLYTLGNNIYTRKNSLTNIYLYIVNNSNTRKRWEICSKSTIKTPARLYC